MIQEVLRICFWSIAFFSLATLPLLVALLGQVPPGRGLLLEFGVALGMIGFAMLAMQFVSTSRFGWVAPYFGTDAQIQFHRETGILAVAFVLAHPLLLFMSDPQYLHYLNPWSNLPRAVFLSTATVSLVLLVVLPLWRISFGLSYEWWRVTHGGLALLVILVGIAHALQVGHYVNGWQKQAFWVVGGGISVLLLLHTRLLKPWQARKRPWRVVEVHPDTQDVYRLVLEPVGHAGMPFRAGQYAWLTVSTTPFALQQHPFSFASSDRMRPQLQFGIKESGDFTASVKDLQPGSRAYLEGPYGRFTLDPDADGAVFVIGGIGITPALSILGSCRDREDPRPMLLIYANDREEDIAFREPVDQLAKEINLTVVHVLESPPDGWEGETGMVTPELLARHLPEPTDLDLQCFVCGPPPMMDAVERALLDHGISLSRLVSERFDLV